MAEGESTASSAPAAVNVDSGARYQARIALITAVVALVSAILGPLVSLKINSDQIASQGEQNVAQNKADREASESEFVRTERRAVYADYLAAYNNGALDLTEAGGKLTVPGYPVKLAAQETESLITTLREVTARYYAVSLLVSPNAQDEATASYQLFAQRATELLAVAGRVTAGEDIAPAELQEVSDGLGQGYADLIASSETFIDTAREDLRADTEAD